MDGFAKRVLLSIVAVLSLLWLGMLAWAVEAFGPFLSSKLHPPTSTPSRSEDVMRPSIKGSDPSVRSPEVSTRNRTGKEVPAEAPRKDGFTKPTTGRFADGFGYRIHPLTGKKAFHEGLDLAPGWRARVLAAQDGTVRSASIRAGYGRLIVLDHGGDLTSWYAHLDEMLVETGREVKKGDVIGKVGRSGSATGPHLHFEIRLANKPQNPLLYLTH